MFIRSRNLFLRPGWEEDWQELHAGIADHAVARHLTRVPWPYTAEEAREFSARGQDGRYPHFLVTLPGSSGSRVIGVVGLSQGEGAPNLGYWIARDYWNRGFATEAAGAVLDFARVLGHRRIEARYFADNPASGRVLRKLGFCPTGAIRTASSPARGEEAPAVAMALMLGKPKDCDGDDFPAARAA